MAKKKTREQKILADTRHFSYHLDTNPAQVSSSGGQKEGTTSTYKLNLATSRPSTSTASYAYVSQDLRKTALITGAILITQLVIYFALNRT